MFQEFFRPVISFFESLAHVMPLEAYVLIGSFCEEIIAPIPQSLIVVVAGTMAKTQEYSLVSLIGLVVLSSLGKTLAGWILYIIGDKGEHLIVGKFGKVLGITEQEMEKWSKYLNKGWKDSLFLFIARTVPIIPTAPVSVVCGIFKINVQMFLFITFIGLTIRNALFIYLGYIGVSSYESMSGNLGSAESITKIIVFVLFLGFFCWMGYKMTKRRLKEMEK